MNSFLITTKNLACGLNRCCVIIVDNVLIATAKITKIFYPESVTDDFDQNISEINDTVLAKIVKHGKNVLIGKNVQDR